jgi:tRNA threonylcarbamoyladenosine biosynthesis protein TsaB
VNILLIKSDQPLAELYIYWNSDLLAKLLWQADRQLAESISLKINDLLKSVSLKLEQLDGIGVFGGPGSFTGLRIGISVANAMSYGLAVPIVGVRGEDWTNKAITRLQKGENDTVVQAHYGASARVTQPRK